MLLTKKPPCYRIHKQTGQAVITLDGRDHYLGTHGSATSGEHYARVKRDDGSSCLSHWA